MLGQACVPSCLTALRAGVLHVEPVFFFCKLEQGWEDSLVERAQRGVPLYLQLKQVLRDQIGSGDLRPGDRVPSERELSEQFEMSRMTVRQALLELVRDGMLHREQGRGTFVAENKMSQALLAITGFTEDMEARGITAGSRTLYQGATLPDPRTRALLQLPLGARVIELRRLRLAGGRPMAIETAWLPRDLLPDLEHEPFENRSLYAYLAAHNVTLKRGRQTLESVLADAEQSRLLGVLPGAPLLLAERLSFDASGIPVELVNGWYRGDRYQFFVDLSR